MAAASTNESSNRRFTWRRIVGALIALLGLAGTLWVSLAVGFDQLWSWPAAAAALLIPAVMLAFWFEERYPDRFPPWLTRGLALIAAKFAFVAWLVEQREITRQNRNLLTSFDATLAAYDIPRIPGAVWDRLEQSGRLLSVGRLTRLFGGPDNRRPSKLALDLLYRERYGMPRLNLWLAHRDELALELAPLVMRGDRLPAPTEGFPYTAEALATVMEHQRAFSVDVLAGTLRLLGELWRRMVRYRDFLASTEAATRSLSAREVLRRIEAERGLPVNAETLYRLRDPGLAMELLETCEDPNEAPLLRVMRRGLFLAEVDLDAARLRERVCRQAVYVDRLPEMLHGYLVAKDRLRHVALAALEGDWRDWVDVARLRLGDDYLTEVTAVQSDLQGGYWPTVHRHIGRSANRPATTDETGFAALEDAIEDVPSETVDALYPHLRKLVHDSVGFARALDALADLDAYMITFDSYRGPVRAMVDCLADPHFERQLEEIGVGFRAGDGGQIYNFGPYTMQTRIGLVPKGWTFEDFHERFKHDFRTVFVNRTQLFPHTKALLIPDADYKRMELTLNRIDLFHSRYLEYDGPFGQLFQDDEVTSIEIVYAAIVKRSRLNADQQLALRKLVDIVEGKREPALT